MCQKLCIYYGIIINLFKTQGSKFDVFIEYPKDQQECHCTANKYLFVIVSCL